MSNYALYEGLSQWTIIKDFRDTHDIALFTGVYCIQIFCFIFGSFTQIVRMKK